MMMIISGFFIARNHFKEARNSLKGDYALDKISPSRKE
jgi:hypothetical protein